MVKNIPVIECRRDIFCFMPLYLIILGKRDVEWSDHSFSPAEVTNIAEAPGMLSIMAIASFNCIIIHAVASASAVIHSGAMTVTDKIVVMAGRR